MHHRRDLADPIRCADRPADQRLGLDGEVQLVQVLSNLGLQGGALFFSLPPTRRLPLSRGRSSGRRGGPRTCTSEVSTLIVGRPASGGSERYDVPMWAGPGAASCGTSDDICCRFSGPFGVGAPGVPGGGASDTAADMASCGGRVRVFALRPLLGGGPAGQLVSLTAAVFSFEFRTPSGAPVLAGLAGGGSLGGGGCRPFNFVLSPAGCQGPGQQRGGVWTNRASRGV